MRRIEYELEKRIADMLGPAPGPEDLILDQVSDTQFQWHLERDGRVIPPEEVPSAWLNYVDEALCRLGRTPGTGMKLPAGAKHRA